MDSSIPDRLFQKYSALVYEKSGIQLREEKKALLQARLNKRLRVVSFPSYESYFEFISSPENVEELTHFIDCISTNLTFFFREPQHFELLDKLLPENLQRKRTENNPRIRIWSAGCSTGEEPYSLAMSVLEHLDGSMKWDFRILASDISTRVLKSGQEGLYTKDKIGKVPPALRTRYFSKVPSNNGHELYRVVPQLKQIIAFRRVNLQEPFPFHGPFDYVFCRNVMIYFDKPTQESLIRRIADYLAPGGYLFVGHSESLTGLSHPLRYVQPAVYRK